MYIILMLILAIVGAIVLAKHNLKDLAHNSTWVETVFNLEVLLIAIIIIQLCGIELALTILTLVLAPFWFWARKQLATDNLYKESMVYQLASTFPLLFAIFFIRSFIIQPYRVPTGSLAPSIHIGDFIAVNQYIYGPKIPIIHKNIFQASTPKRGDIALFYWPIQPQTILVKRVIGLPGDHISYHHHVLTINNKIVSHKFIKNTEFTSHNNQVIGVKLLEETLPGGKKHQIFQNQSIDNLADGDWSVPAKHYFMMGDNRDNSNDSRFWGMVPETAFVGKGMLIWMNFDITALMNKDWTKVVLWQRIGNKL